MSTPTPEEEDALKALKAVLKATGGAPLLGMFGGEELDPLARVGQKPSVGPVTGYVGPDGSNITREQWAEMQCQPSEVTRREYQNDKVLVRLLWQGRWERPHVVPRDQASIFVVMIEDRCERTDIHGNVSVEFTTAPDGRSFAHYVDALRYYEQVVGKWTESFVDEHGKLVEIGNQLDPDVPKSTALFDDGDEGAW